MRVKLLLVLVLYSCSLGAQQPARPDPYDGLWEGYDGEWRYVSSLLLSLADAIPAEKYSWRPSPGVRSVSEAFVHITQANFYLLSVTGPRMPPEMEHGDLEKTLVSKDEVIAALRRSLDAVKHARTQLNPGDLNRRVNIHGKTVSVDGMYLRIVCHDNEHLGQLIAYARVVGITPPWSQPMPESK